MATNFKDKEAQDKYDDLDTDATRNWGKGKDELVNIINTAIGDVLSLYYKRLKGVVVVILVVVGVVGVYHK